jgi:hypothetical protein
MSCSIFISFLAIRGLRATAPLNLQASEYCLKQHYLCQSGSEDAVLEQQWFPDTRSKRRKPIGMASHNAHTRACRPG